MIRRSLCRAECDLTSFFWLCSVKPTFDHVTIYGMGAAATRAGELAAQVMQRYPARLENTRIDATTMVFDDYEPLEEACVLLSDCFAN